MTEEVKATNNGVSQTAAKRTLGEMADNLAPRTSEPKRSKSVPDLSGVEILDPEGDVVLVLKISDPGRQNKYLASSRILSLASPVFNKMFSPAFSEGERVRNGDVPLIDLQEDDPEAMGSILRILHYNRQGIPFEIAPGPLSAIAIHCDKYDCKNALEVWIRHWCGAKCFQDFSTSTPENIGITIVAAYMFRSSALFFSNVASQASKFLRLDFQAVWEQQTVITLLPATFTSSLLNHIEDTLGRLRTTIYSVDQTLQLRSKGYKIPGQRMCLPCDVIFTQGEKKCACGNFVVEKCCTVEFRVAEYFALLRRHGLYPAEEPFNTLSVAEIYNEIYYMVKGYGHKCAGGHNCPLKMALKKMSDDALAIVKAVDFAWTWS